MKTQTRKIRFIQTLATSRATYRRGHEYDVPADEAEQYTRHGIASTVEAASPPVATGTEPKARKTKDS